MAEIGQVVAGACYTCVFCGYVYDPAIGDPGENIPPGTPFANLPEDWCCPNCSTEKDTFERCEAATAGERT